MFLKLLIGKINHLKTRRSASRTFIWYISQILWNFHCLISSTPSDVRVQVIHSQNTHAKVLASPGTQLLPPPATCNTNVRVNIFFSDTAPTTRTTTATMTSLGQLFLVL